MNRAMNPIVFLNAGLLFDNARVVAAPPGTLQGTVLRVFQGRPSPTSAAINRLCSEAGAQLVLSDNWGQRDGQEAMTTCGITAPLHEHWRVSGRPPFVVGQTGRTEYTGGWGDQSQFAPQTISLAPPAPFSPIADWLAYHGRRPAVMIDRPGAQRVDGCILVTIDRGYHLSDSNVDRVLAALRGAA